MAMNLVLMGCEYSGKTSLAIAISRWLIAEHGRPYVRWHNHFVLPKVDQHLIVRPGVDDYTFLQNLGKQLEDLNTAEDEAQLLTMRPNLLEQFMRHMIWRHLYSDNFTNAEDYLLINFYFADAVYAPLYYGYGEPGSFADRQQRARAWDAELLRHAPDVVLVLVHASPEVVRQRMRAHPRPRCILRAPDVERVQTKFEQEFARSLIKRRFTLDTTMTPVDETLRKFKEQLTAI